MVTFGLGTQGTGTEHRVWHPHTERATLHSEEAMEMVCYRLNFVSDLYVVVPSVSTLECDCILRQGLKGGNFKTSSLALVLIQYDWCLYKKRKLGRRHTHREDHVRTQQEDSHLQTKKEYFEEINPDDTLFSNI